MFGSASKSAGTSATINAQPIRVLAGETLLTAALREGVEFPHSCRVGGCGTCKCRLVEGQVRELTEFSYLLSAEELAQRTILACQSVPLGPVCIEVEQTKALAVQACGATVIAQEPLTHDIQRLRLQLDAPLHYKPGQFAQISLASLPNVTRSYSFATAPDASGRVEFFVRRVPGGLFTEHVHGQNLRGTKAHVQGPLGQFWLRTSDAPLLFIAGGSGLAPVMAMLKAAHQQRLARSVTLLFGARTQDDLYRMEELRYLAEHSAGKFTLRPVLSEAQDDATWRGARGLVTEHLSQVVEPGMHAYLCGPPGMVDAASAALQKAGLPKKHTHADRFTTRHDAPLPAEASMQDSATTDPPAAPQTPGERLTSLWHYLKFFLFHVEGLAVAAALFAGGGWITLVLVAFLLFNIVGDMVLGDDTSTPSYRHPKVLTVQLWMALPLLLLICFAAV